MHASSSHVTICGRIPPTNLSFTSNWLVHHGWHSASGGFKLLPDPSSWMMTWLWGVVVVVATIVVAVMLFRKPEILGIFKPRVALLRGN